MLVLDGCFLLEFFLSKGEGHLAAPGGAKWAWHHMYHDALLLENQLPFFVLEKLHGVAFAAGEEDAGRDALLDIFCKAFAGDLPSSRAIRPPSDKAIHTCCTCTTSATSAARPLTATARAATASGWTPAAARRRWPSGSSSRRRRGGSRRRALPEAEGRAG
ncbi:unnamed protein product [Urochloa humidicola]